MERWADFDVVTRDALLATLSDVGVDEPPDLDAVAEAFVRLPLAAGAADAIASLRADGLTTGILTNATQATLGRVLDGVQLGSDHRLSVDAVQRFKPHPDVYRLAVDATTLPADSIGFVTANGWDAVGAGAFGFRVAWLRPGPASTLPAVGAPEPTVATWSDLPRLFGQAQ